jgi:hypothetical protein
MAASRCPACHLFTIKLVRNLDKNTGTVALQRIGTNGTAVIQIFQDQQTLLDDAMLFWPLKWATKPTPQASCSLAGSYKPCRSGTAGSITRVPSNRLGR